MPDLEFRTAISQILQTVLVNCDQKLTEVFTKKCTETSSIYYIVVAKSTLIEIRTCFAFVAVEHRTLSLPGLSIWNGGLAGSHTARVACAATRPSFVRILQPKTDKAEVAAAWFAQHMLALVDVVDEYPASRARSGTGTAANRSYRLRAALLQLHHLRRRPVAVAVSAALVAWPPRFQAVPADRHLVAGSPRALVADHARPLRVPFLAEVSLQVRPAGTALPHLRFPLLEVAVDPGEGSLQLVGAHH